MQIRLTGKSAVLILAILGFSCTCERDEEQMAASPDGRATVTRHYAKEVGCGAAGGHGFGLIFPTVDEDTRLDLHIKDGPRAGRYELTSVIRLAKATSGSVTTSESFCIAAPAPNTGV